MYRWHEISGHPPDRPLSDWAEAVHPDDLHILQQLVTEIQDEGRQSANVQFRYKHGRWAQLEVRPSAQLCQSLADLPLAVPQSAGFWPYSGLHWSD